jgi:hypothetical protein
MGMMLEIGPVVLQAQGPSVAEPLSSACSGAAAPPGTGLGPDQASPRVRGCLLCGGFAMPGRLP